MDVLELRKLVTEFPKYPGTRSRSPASVCNDGFPGTFNLSFTEPDWIKEFNGQYLDFDRDLVFSKIQPCIRHQDWNSIKNNDPQAYSYLSVFDMADVSGAISMVDRSKLDTIIQFSVESLYTFLTKQLGLSTEKIRVKYCQGGSITKLTNGKYTLEENILPDPEIARWLHLGISQDQLIPDESRDSLLALHIYGIPTPWGYRNEVFYEHQGRLLDIATFEYLCWRPIFNADGASWSILKIGNTALRSPPLALKEYLWLSTDTRLSWNAPISSHYMP